MLPTNDTPFLSRYALTPAPRYKSRKARMKAIHREEIQMARDAKDWQKTMGASVSAHKAKLAELRRQSQPLTIAEHRERLAQLRREGR